jgi:hypothetical protein
MSARVPRRVADLVALCFLGALLMVLVLSADARAAEQLSCTGSETNTYNPGLHLRSQTVSATIALDFSSCTSVTDPTVTSGSSSGASSSSASCLSVLAGPGRTLTRTVHWSNGQSSTLQYDTLVDGALGALVITTTGAVVSGGVHRRLGGLRRHPRGRPVGLPVRGWSDLASRADHAQRARRLGTNLRRCA